MRKRLLSLLLAAAMLASMLPAMTLPASAAETTEKEIDQSTYEALGLNLYSDEDTAANSVTAPFKEDGVATSIAAREVYVALNAAHGNRYTLRDGLDKVDPYTHDNTREQHSGAYAFYGGSPSSIKAENGNTVYSGLSSNTGDNVLASQGNGFNGIYATSVALDGGDGKDNYVAELRAYGNTSKTSYGGRDDYAGKLEVVVFKIGDDGSRTQVTALTPKLNDSSFYSNSVAYLARRYVQELDAYFEIEAGDLNGDGLDDLAAYTGRYKDVDGRRYALVDVFYATASGNWETAPSQEIAVDAGYASSYSKIDYNNDNNWKEEIVKHPVVTIAMGDIDRNLKDELAVVSSAPANNNDADNVAHFSLLACDEEGSLNPVGEMENVALNDGAGSGLISAGCAFGEFAQIDNQSVSATTLIIGGWSAGSSVITRNEASAGYSQGAYYYVYYDYATGQYIQSGYRAQSLGGNTKSISQVFNLEGQQNGGNGVRVYPTLAPMAIACGDLDGSKVQSVSDQVLFGTQVMEFSLETGFGSELFSFDFCMTQVDDKNNNRDKEQPWIGDVVVGTVDSDPSEKGWREMFLFVTGVHRKSEINTSDDYYYMDLGAIWRRETASETDAKEGYFILFEGIMAKSNARNDTYGTFVSLALPDVGNDSVMMKFVDKGIVYTDPEVFAVLQASPYFSDLEEVYGYIGNGGTSYGESQGSSTTGGASISGSYGFYHSATVQAVAAAEYEFSLVATASYDYSYSSDKETAISYNNQAGGGDKVVVYTIPNVLYIYEVYTPGTNGASGTWDQVVMTTPLQAVVTMLDVDAYDEVAASTAGLEPIRGNILYSTPGQPETYVNKPAGQQEAIYDTYAQSSSAGSGSDITQEFSFSETNEHAFSVGFDFNFKVGAGGGGLGNELMFGAMGNIAASGSGGWSRTEGTSFSGTVDALPEEAEGYSFSWRLLVNQAALGGNDVWVVGYDVKDVVQPPRMPQNLTVTEVGTDYVDLEWESGGNAASYILYQKTTTGNYNQVAVLPYTAESYRHEGRNPNTTYTYTIQAVSSAGATSIYSPEVAATTMWDNASFSIVTHPSDAHAYAGGSARFSAQGSGQGGYGTVGYEWQVNETGRAGDWKRVSGTGVAGASSTSLTLSNVTQEMDGWQYRCRIYYDQYELFTAPAALIVDKADSQVTVSVLDGDSMVTGDTVLSAKGSVVTTGSDTVGGKKAVSVTKDDKTYTLLSGQDSAGSIVYYWFDGTNYYAYTGTQAPVLTDPDAPFDGTNTIAETAQTLTATDYTTTIGGETVELSGPTEVTGDAITIPDPEGGEAYTAKRSWTGDGCTVYEVTRTVDGVVETETFYTSGGDAPSYTTCNITYTNVITVSEGVTLDVSNLATTFQTTTSTTTTTQTHTSEGKAYTLTATPKASAGSDAVTGADNRVYFSISNGASGETVEAAWNEALNCYTAQWTPALTGKLTITAVFTGNEKYLSSQSDPFAVYSAVQVENIATSSLSMSAPTNMLYGQAGTLAVTKLTVEHGAATSADVTTSGTVYTVEKRDENGAYQTAGSADYTLSGGAFTPMAVGTFRITAANDNLTASAVISVGKATLTIAAQDTEKAVNDENRDSADATITTNNGQMVRLTRNTDYTVTSEGTTATLPGTYPIQVALKDTQTIRDLQTNYNIITQGATYTLTSEAYQVTAAAGANGSVSVSYQADDNSAVVPVQSGTSLPEGSKVTVTAMPETGYVVSCWMVNNAYVTESGSASYYTGTTHTIDSLAEDSTISVEFTLGISTLSYEALSEGGSTDTPHGQVTAYYVEGGIQGGVCASGNAVNYNQVVRVAAIPDEGYAIHHWTVQKGNGEPQTLLAADGVSFFTGESYDFSQFSENMTVSVYFVEEQTIPVTIKPVDNNGGFLANASVTVNGEPLTAEDGAFTYEGKTGENLTITVTPPSGVLVQEWTVGENQATGSLSNQNQTMTLYNLQGTTDFTVKCAALNTFRVTFSGALEDGDFSDTVGSVTADKIGTTGTGLTSGEQQTQGSAILFTAEAQDGYEIAGWTVNGQPVQAGGTPVSQTYQIPNLSGDVNVVVTFRAKPQVTIPSISNTQSVTVTGTVNGQEGQIVADGEYVDFGTDITVTVTPESSHVVTKICDTEVNEAKTNGSQNITVQTVTSDQTISAEVAAKPIVTIESEVNGSVTAMSIADGAEKALTSDDYVDFGTDVVITLSPDKGYVVADSIAADYTDGTGETTDDKTYTISDVQEDQTIALAWTELDTYAIDFSVVDLTGNGQGNGGALSADMARKGMADYNDTVPATGSGNVTVYAGGTITLTAAAEDGYRVKEWTVDGQVYKTDGQVYTGGNLTLTPDQAQTVTVQFQLGDPIVTFGDPDHGTLTAETERGTPFTSGGATSVAVNFTVTPDTNYEVKQWTVNGAVQRDNNGNIITDETFSIKPSGDVTVAVELQGVMMDVTASAGQGGSASVSPEIVRYGDTVTFTAQADTGYHFDGWYVDGSKVESNTTYTVPHVTADIAVEARFAATADNQVNFSVSDDTMGAITAAVDGGPIRSGDMLAGGTKVVFTVVPQEGYRVKAWTGLPADAEISDDKNTATVAALPGSLTVQAVLEAIPMHTVTIEAPQHGTITAEANGQPIASGAQVPDGTQVTFTANPDPNWIFSTWTGDASGQSDRSFTMAVTGDITVGVTFEDAIHYVVHYSVVGTGGTLSGTADDQTIAIDTDVQVVGGSKVVFTAEPASGMMVKAWTVNGQVQDELSNTLVIDNLSETTAVTVEFETLVFYDLPVDTADYTITNITKTPEYGTERQIRKGGDVTFTVKPAQGKAITALTVNNGGTATQNADGSWTVTVENVQDHITLNATVVSGIPLAITEPANGTITVKRGDDTLSSGAALQTGDQLVITAAASSGYTLKSLTVNGVTFTSGGTYTVKDTDQAVTVAATFEKQSDQGGSGGSGGGGTVVSDYPITVLDSVHGTVTADKERAEKEAIVTLTVKPDQGYQLDTLTVTDQDGESVQLTDKGDGIFTFQMPASKVIVEAAFVEETTQPVELPFIDVNEGDWFFDAVYHVYDKNLMDGTSSMTFEPFLTTTRSMMVTILWRLEGEPLVDDTATFEDVERDTWYTKAVNWGASEKVVTGYSDKAFGPNDIVTREQLATILYRYAQNKGCDVSAKGDLTAFTDGGETSSWAAEAMEWAVGSGLLTGKGGGVLDPTGSATRAEVATIFMRFMELQAQ